MNKTEIYSSAIRDYYLNLSEVKSEEIADLIRDLELIKALNYDYLEMAISNNIPKNTILNIFGKELKSKVIYSLIETISNNNDWDILANIEQNISQLIEKIAVELKIKGDISDDTLELVKELVLKKHFKNLKNKLAFLIDLNTLTTTKRYLFLVDRSENKAKDDNKQAEYLNNLLKIKLIIG